jgi:glycerophosphoryl diester phosphodiesterase
MISYLKIGHRGAKGHVVENTMESIRKALELGVDGVEIDVHKCASSELVVFHDFTLDRMTNGSGEIKAFSLSELKKLKVNGGFKIPTLVEVLDVINKKCFVNIELKGANTAVRTFETIRSYIQEKGWSYNDFIVSSFQHKELQIVADCDSNIQLGVLTKANVDEAIEFAKIIKAVAVHPNQALLSKENVKRAQNEGYKVYTWTVNDVKTINRMKSYHVDGIISDFPDRL